MVEISPSALLTLVFRPLTSDVSVVILPSELLTRVVRLVAVCSRVEMSPSAVDTRVLIPLTSALRETISPCAVERFAPIIDVSTCRIEMLPSASEIRASRLSWVRIKEEIFSSFFVTLNAILEAVCLSSDTLDSTSRMFSSTTSRSFSTVSTRVVTKETVLVRPSRLLCIVLDLVVRVLMLERKVSVPFCSFQAEPL